MNKPLLLIVDDDALMVDLVSSIGEDAGFDICQTTNSEAFQQAWLTNPPRAIIMDIVMPGMDGMALLLWLSEQNCTTPIILMSGYAGKYLGLAEKLGTATGENIIGTLDKPFNIDKLEVLLEKALQVSES
ncbi:MAG: hypothetical protein COB46_12895 [Rhodospirillaceae bacterium]|nr:MAG: hypothetical protein COB46_12895 [Rhodospirillaceae bacterium]